MWFLYLVCLIIALIIGYIIAQKFSDIAEMKGHEGGTYFWFTFLFGLVGMLMVIALPNETKNDICDFSKEEKTVLYTNSAKIEHKESLVPQNNKDDNSSKSVQPSIKENNIIVCPLCNFEQPANRKVCWHCGAKFEEYNSGASHKWLCDGCKKMRTQSPCEHCGEE